MKVITEAPLTLSHGTLVCRGTPVENHCPGESRIIWMHWEHLLRFNHGNWKEEEKRKNQLDATSHLIRSKVLKAAKKYGFSFFPPIDWIFQKIIVLCFEFFRQRWKWFSTSGSYPWVLFSDSLSSSQTCSPSWELSRYKIICKLILCSLDCDLPTLANCVRSVNETALKKLITHLKSYLS